MGGSKIYIEILPDSEQLNKLNLNIGAKFNEGL